MLETEDDELLGPARLPRRRVLAAGAGVVVLVAAAVTAIVVARPDSGNRHSHQAGPTQPSVAAPATPAPVATDAFALAVGGGSPNFATSSHVVTYTADLLNDTGKPLVLSGPVQAIGPNGAPLPGVTAFLAPSTVDLVTERRSRRVTELAPGQQVTLVVRAKFDCPPSSEPLPAGYPHIVIPLRDYPSPADYKFSYFWESGNGAPGFLAGLCTSG